MQYRRLRAPQEHGQRLIDPPVSSSATLVAENRTTSQCDHDVSGHAFQTVARQARRDLLEAARRFTKAYRDVATQTLDEDAPIVMAGHQPAFFHPGVWFKNFVLHDVAKNLNATAVNLLIDNDVAQQAAIRVPTGSVLAPRVETVSYDRAQPNVPFEECRLLDPERFASFGKRVFETVRPFSPDPLITQLWPLAEQAAARSMPVHLCLAEARHRLEHLWGLETLELPLSEVCQQTAFRWFMAHLLTHAHQFLTTHNEVLGDYRRVNRVRSKTHPVPGLTQHDQWHETPFWIWTRDNPRRRALFARQTSGQVELSDLDGVTLPAVRFSARNNATVAYFAEQESLGIKIRPRALMTTMFARLFLSDLFIHGIGGAKYDQLTDELIQRFFGRPAPHFLVVTASAHLPIPRDPVKLSDLGNLQQLEREFRFHPECHLEMTSATKSLIAEKQKWVQNDSPGDRRLRHQAITRLNETMGEFLHEKQLETAVRKKQVAAALARERVLGSREHSFCLFSQTTLQPLLLDI